MGNETLGGGNAGSVVLFSGKGEDELVELWTTRFEPTPRMAEREAPVSKSWGLPNRGQRTPPP